MFGRTAKTAAAFLAGVMALVLLPTVASPVSAAPASGGAGAPRVNQPFQLSLVQGSLLIDGAAEAYSLPTPTIISGQHDTGEVVEGAVPTGAVTEGVLTVPVVSFEVEALGLPVQVEATLAQVTPASGTGSIDANGNMRFSTAMSVSLNIKVATINDTCATSPVEIVLDSTAPYNPSTKRITLRDPDFSVPPVSVTPTCQSIVAENVNELLAGGGHSLTMTMSGDLVLPPKAECDTDTTLSVAPATEAGFGDVVTFTGTVARDPAEIGHADCEGVAADAIPSGLIDFLDGPRIIGTAAVDSAGVATFTTDDLPAGSFDFTASYRSSPPFDTSTSAVVPYRVTADPLITADVPNLLRVGAATPTEFDVTVTNSPLGKDITNGRLALTITGPVGLPSFAIEYQEDNGTWTAPPIGGSIDIFARIDPLVGRPIPKGTEVTRRVRIRALSDAIVFPYRFVFELIQVDPGTGAPAPAVGQLSPESPPTPGQLAATESTVTVLGAGRLTPAWTASGGVTPHTIRQGQTLRVDGFSPTLTGDGLVPTGKVRVLFDGKEVPIRTDITPPSIGFQPFIEFNPQAAGLISPEFIVPVDAGTGDRTVTVVYEGDTFFAPAQWSGTVRVLAARGTTYTCSSSLINVDRITFNVQASAVLPAAARPGEEIDLDGLDISLFADRGGSFIALSSLLAPVNPVGAPGLVTIEEISFELAGGQASGTAGAFTAANTFPMFDFTRPEDPAPDSVFGFDEEEGSMTLEGAPGDEIAVPLDRILVTGSGFGGVLSFSLDCVPLGDPLSLGTIALAGAALTVDAPQPARVGDLVSLNVQVHPVGTPGTVEFYDGDDSLGLAAVAPDGTASIQTDELTQGTHELSARFFGGIGALSSTTETVVLEVLEATECAAFAEAGNGAVVRLVYMELLGRCPDQAGYDYWVGRLEGGLSVEAFARSISRTSEALGMVVADAYETMLGRAPDAAGRTYWIGRLRSSGRYDHLLADLGASGEFWSKAGSTNEGFVTRVYERLLDRAPDQGGLDYWVGRLEGGTSRRALILSLANLSEPLGRLVALSYDEILSRAPSSGERTAGITHLRSTGDRSALYAQLMGTSEFEERAQDFPNPED